MSKAVIIKQNLGIDVSKNDFKVCLFFMDSFGIKVIKGSRKFKNTLEGFKRLANWCDKKKIEELAFHVCLEATGIYHENLTYYLHDLGYKISVVLPNKTSAYAKSLNLKSKTDDIDARMLGQMGIERSLQAWKPGSPNMLTLKQLCRERTMLLTEKTAMTNRLHALKYAYNSDKRMMQRIKQMINTFEKQIAQVEKQIEGIIQKDPVLESKIAKITKVKGLGWISVVTILAETNGFEQFKSRSQLVSYAGYDVVQKESGTSIKGKTRISKKGNSHIRRAMYFPAITVVRFDENFKQTFHRILDKSHIKMKAYVAIQRKLLVLIYALYKNDTAYDPNYQQEIKQAA